MGSFWLVAGTKNRGPEMGSYLPQAWMRTWVPSFSEGCSATWGLGQLATRQGRISESCLLLGWDPYPLYQWVFHKWAFQGDSLRRQKPPGHGPSGWIKSRKSS